MRIKSLSVYPLKSAAGHELPSAIVGTEGLVNDRRFVLVDSRGRFVTQRAVPALARLGIRLGQGLRLSFGEQTLHLSAASGPQREVEVWGDKVLAQDWGDEAAQFLDRALQPFSTDLQMRLCERLPDHPRLASSAFTHGESVPYFFADAFPILVITQESLDLLNSKLADQQKPPVNMDRFRTNIVIEGASPHAEDQWHRIRIGDQLELVLAKLCSRCPVVTVDQKKGEISNREPLATLASYRTINGKIMFGQNAYVARGSGSEIFCGDPVTILSSI